MILDLFIVMIGKNTSFAIWDVLLLASFFCHRSLNAWPHVPVFYCSTKPVYLFFTVDRAVFGAE